ncbi:hypothetical protein SK128_025706 [Halocaridina rubra]|uniref:F-box domain-containing protein n=1 Tax=Halocaridina rubra TaxID=373956 RepID=A0AAN8ZXB9_HALRR
MKLKIKYSSTQKFIINLQDASLENLKNEIRKFVENSYKETVSEPLTVSLNGSDPLFGNDDSLLTNLGIVPGDMLTVLAPSACPDQAQVPSVDTSSKAYTSAKGDEEKKAKLSRDDVDLDKGNLLEVKDGHPSTALDALFRQCSPESASQAVNLIVHLTMTECGFCLQNDVDIPSGWKETVATFHYCHKNYPEFTCTLYLANMGDVTQVLAIFPKQDRDISVKLKIFEYVKDPNISPIPASKLVRVAHLARVLRDYLLHPLHVAAHQALGVPAPWHLLGLPHEILLKIASSLEAHSVLNVAQTCKHLNAVMEDNKLWHILYKRHFKNLYEHVENYNLVDWKAKYRETVQREKEWNRLCQEGMEFVIPEGIPTRPRYPPHPFMPYPGMPRPRGDNPYPPQPHPIPNPFYDPDSPYFGGEIPPMPNPFPIIGDPLDPFGMGVNGRRPPNPFNPPFMPPRPRNPRGPRFDFF